jgi:hypothetical protein
MWTTLTYFHCTLNSQIQNRSANYYTVKLISFVNNLNKLMCTVQTANSVAYESTSSSLVLIFIQHADHKKEVAKFVLIGMVEC